jgi:RNA polymerase sigma-70 factor (ECF subfamily)
MRDRDAVLDELLILRCQAGDVHALEALAMRWHPRMRLWAARVTRDPHAAEDVAQDAWIGIAQGLGRLRDPARFRSWAHRIVRNKARDWIRREQARRRSVKAWTITAAQRESAGLTEPPGARELARITEALERLPIAQRAILRWFYIDERSVREIAEAVSIPEGTVKSRLYHAREALRRSLEEVA